MRLLNLSVLKIACFGLNFFEKQQKIFSTRHSFLSHMKLASIADHIISRKCYFD